MHRIFPFEREKKGNENSGISQGKNPGKIEGDSRWGKRMEMGIPGFRREKPGKLKGVAAGEKCHKGKKREVKIPGSRRGKSGKLKGVPRGGKEWEWGPQDPARKKTGND
jgi:hypothetical protein